MQITSEQLEAKEKLKDDSLTCRMTAGAHNYIPTVKILTPKSETVAQIMCTHCFHYLSIQEAVEISHR